MMKVQITSDGRQSLRTLTLEIRKMPGFGSCTRTLASMRGMSLMLHCFVWGEGAHSDLILFICASLNLE